MKQRGLLLLALTVVAVAACTSSGGGEISEEEAIEIALNDWEKLRDEPHSSYEEPRSISAEIDEVLADADDQKERVWVVRFELSGGAEEGFYIETTSGKILGGFGGEP